MCDAVGALAMADLGQDFQLRGQGVLMVGYRRRGFAKYNAFHLLHLMISTVTDGNKKGAQFWQTEPANCVALTYRYPCNRMAAIHLYRNDRTGRNDCTGTRV